MYAFNLNEVNGIMEEPITKTSKLVLKQLKTHKGAKKLKFNLCKRWPSYPLCMSHADGILQP